MFRVLGQFTALGKFNSRGILNCISLLQTSMNVHLIHVLTAGRARTWLMATHVTVCPDLQTATVKQVSGHYEDSLVG